VNKGFHISARMVEVTFSTWLTVSAGVQYNADTTWWRKEYDNNRLVSSPRSPPSCQHNRVHSSAFARSNVRHQRFSVYRLDVLSINYNLVLTYLASYGPC